MVAAQYLKIVSTGILFWCKMMTGKVNSTTLLSDVLYNANFHFILVLLRKNGSFIRLVIYDFVHCDSYQLLCGNITDKKAKKSKRTVEDVGSQGGDMVDFMIKSESVTPKIDTSK